MVSVLLQQPGTCSRLGLAARHLYTASTFSQTKRCLSSSAVSNMGDRIDQAKLSQVEELTLVLFGFIINLSRGSERTTV